MPCLQNSPCNERTPYNSRDMIVLMAGLPGTGKSRLARELALRTAGRVISKDEIRHALFAEDEIEYSSRQDDFCLQIMVAVAGGQFVGGRNSVFFFLGWGRF